MAKESRGYEIIEMLGRRDKWFLGGGTACLWAPEWPLHLDAPGFWEHGTYLDYDVGPLFTATLLGQDDREIPLEVEGRSWTPAALTQVYKPAGGLKLTEEKCLTPDDCFTSRFTFENTTGSSNTVHLVVWTAIPRGDVGPNRRYISELHFTKEAVTFTRVETNSSGKPSYSIGFALGVSRKLTSYSMNIAEAGGPYGPQWRYTPFYEKFASGKLGNERKLTGGTNDRGLIFVALHVRVTVPANGKREVVVGLAAGKTENYAGTQLQNALSSKDVIEVSRANWASFFDSVPDFACSDPYIEKCYWYRWFGLRLNMISIKDERLPHPCVFEGINPGWFRHAIAYSAQVHMRELRWMHDPSAAEGSLSNFIENQRRNGSFVGGIVTGSGWNPNESENIYLGDWGRAARDVWRVHGNDKWLSEIYLGLSKYARYLEDERDAEGLGLYDVVNQAETGQEYMSRYLYVDAKADLWGPLQLKGVDATVYAYGIQRALEWMAERVGRSADAAKWKEAADATREAVRSRMWDEKAEMFFDVHPSTHRRSGRSAAVCFYPFFTDIATKEHLGALSKHLLSPKEFWTDYPVPSTSIADEYFSAEGEWKGKRHNCPWNGRSWLMTSSHVCDALGSASVAVEPKLKVKAAELLRKVIGMTFLEGDLERPSSYEYYHPFTGVAPYWRGTDDYMHSYIVDLIIRFVAGVCPQDEFVMVEPLPFKLESFSIGKVMIRGRELGVTYTKKGGLKVTVDGKQRAKARALQPLKVKI